MKPRLLILTLFSVVVLFGILLVTTSSSKPLTAQAERERPTFVPAEQLTPAPTPEDGRQIAVLYLVISQDGERVGIQLERGEILNSYAPNVFGRTGEWTVEIVGRETVTFGIPNPSVVNIYPNEENTQGEEGVPHTSEELTAPLNYELVVPLYMNDQDLGARTINMYDGERNLVFTTEIDREGWTTPRENQ